MRTIDKVRESETDCVLKEFGNCSYSETGCSDCKVKAKIRNALSAQPEPCDDAVSRKAVEEAIISKPAYHNSEGSWYHGSDIRMAISALPSVTPKRKPGRWIDQKGGGCCCSECGRYALDEVDGNFIHVAAKSNYCPNCGADMREGVEQE